MNHFPLDLCPKYEEKPCRCIMHFTKEHMHAFKSFTFHLCFLLFLTHIIVNDSMFWKPRLKAKFKLSCTTSQTASSASLFHDFISKFCWSLFLSLQWNMWQTLGIWLAKKKKKIILQLVCASPTEPAKKENLSLLKQVLRRMCNHVLKDALDQGSVRLLIVDR